jgi:hypothetical protein
MLADFSVTGSTILIILGIIALLVVIFRWFPWR